MVLGVGGLLVFVAALLMLFHRAGYIQLPFLRSVARRGAASR